MSFVKILGVIGCGTMGIGIAQVAAMAGWEVRVFDMNREAQTKALQKLQKILNRLVEKGRISNTESKAIFGRIYMVENMSSFADCDMVIEAIVEDLGIKKTVFQSLEKIVSEQCILASNTSSLSITSIAASCDMPDRVIGVHFFNPAPVMKLVEIVPAIQTNENTLIQATDWIDSWGKLTVKAKDTPAFIVNKVARPFYSEALRIVEEGIATYEIVDMAMTKLAGFRMGPFQLMDFIGNDINFAVTESVFKAFYYDPRYKPSFTQKRMVEAGYLGRKTNKGFYDYNGSIKKADGVVDPILANAIVDRIVVMLINEAVDTLFLNIATKEDIDLAMTKGVNYPKGLFQWANEIGIAECVDRIDALYATYHEDRYRCSPLLRRMLANNQCFYS